MVRIGWTITPVGVPLTAERVGTTFAILAEEVIQLLRPGVGCLARQSVPPTGFQFEIQSVVAVAAIRGHGINRLKPPGRHGRERARLIEGLTVQVSALCWEVQVILNREMGAPGTHIADCGYYRFSQSVLDIQTPALDVGGLPAVWIDR